MTAIPTPEEMVRRVKAAYAEAGWPEVGVQVYAAQPGGWPSFRVYGRSPRPPAAVTWQAAWVVYEGHMPCWSCWRSASRAAQDDCRAGNCHHPEGPARPPREELVRR